MDRFCIMKKFLKKICSVLLLVALVCQVIPPIAVISAESADPVDISGYEGLVISRVFGHGDKKDAVTAYSFFELYNASKNTLDLDGLALYYKTSGGDDYVSFEFGDQTNHVMAPGSYYLIRCNEKNSSAEVITLTHWDATWNLGVSNKEIKLILAAEGRTIDPLVQPAEVDDVISYFCATDTYYFDNGYLIGEISKSKYAVRTALKADSGWQDANLTKLNNAGLRRIMPQYSGGDAGEIVASNYPEVIFSEEAGFFTQGFSLTLTPPSGYTEVYYTLDGSDPTTSASRVLYSAPLTLNDTSSMGPGATTQHVATAMTSKDSRAPGDYQPLNNNYPGGYVVKAVAFDGENYTAVYTNTYFISELFEDYGVSVMSISMDKNDVAGTSPTAFYNHYYTTTNDSNPRSQGIIEVFDENGSRRCYSNIEIAINGHASANYAMKSMKLYFKKSLNQDAGGNQIGGLENKLNYDLFDGAAKNCKGQAITTFSRLVLRNSGNDLYNSMMRDAFEQRASGGLDVDTTAAAPVLVFINGEFWGWYNARERYTEEYVEDHYGVDKDNVTIIENDYTLVRTNTNAPLIVNDGDEGDADPFNALVAFMKTNSMAVDANYRYVTDQIDIDSLIDMYIAHLYFNAIDWPENNIKIWRNKNEEDASGFDTKWHFTLHDTDFGVGFYDGLTATAFTPKSTAQSVNIFNAIDTTTCVVGNVMHALMQNQEFRNYFIAKCYTAFRELYGADRLTAILDEMTAVRTPLMALQIARWGRDYDETLGRQINADTYQLAINQMYTFVKTRQSIALKQLLAYFNITEAQAMELAGYSVSDGTAIAPYTFINASFDHFYINGVKMNNNDANNWIDANLTNRVVPKSVYGGQINSVGFFGWIGFDQPIEAVGYSINGGTPVWGVGTQLYAAENMVRLERNGGPNAMRFAVTVPTSNLNNFETVVAVVRVGGVTVPIDSNLINTGFVTPDTTVIINNTNGTLPVDPEPGEPGQPEDPSGTEPAFVGASFDTLYRNEVALNSGGNANNWITPNLPNRTLKRSVYGNVTTSVRFYGWIGFDQPIEAVGYIINGGDPVFGNFIGSTTEPAVMLPVNGGQYARRFNITVPITNAVGVTTVVAVVRSGGVNIPIDSHLVNTNSALAVPDTSLTVDNTPAVKTYRDQIMINGTDVAAYGNNPDPTELSLTGQTGNQLELWGLHANDAGIVKFGYRVDGGEAVWSSSTAIAATQAELTTARAAIGQNAIVARFRIFVPIAAGSHTVEALCDTGNGILSIWTVEYQSGELPSEPEPEPEPKLEIAAYNLAFMDSVYIRYAVDTDLDSEISMLIWLAPQENYTVGTQYTILSSYGIENVYGEDMIAFKFTEFAAKQMADVVYARAYTVKDGQTYYSDVKKYSIQQYVYNKTGKTGTASSDPDLIALLNAMLNYGAAAQTYFGYRTDRMVNADYWYQISVTGGRISDGSDRGLYVTGESVTLTAPSVDADGYPFSHWETAGGENAGTTRSITVTVGTANAAYTAVYSR